MIVQNWDFWGFKVVWGRSPSAFVEIQAYFYDCSFPELGKSEFTKKQAPFE